MPDTNLDRLLRSIGKSVFVRYYREFADPTLTNQELIDLLPQRYTYKSRLSRTTKARRIFREGLEKEALMMIINSDRVDTETVDEAKRLLYS